MAKVSSSLQNTTASSNWLALQKVLHPPGSKKHLPARKRQKLDTETTAPITSTAIVFPRGDSLRKSKDPVEEVDFDTTEMKNGESIAGLRKMVLGRMEYSDAQAVPGKYLALDCEMVGVGIEGSESSLARVSVVNYAGAVVLDVFVRQRERVVDYRTQWSGVRKTDLGNTAKPFEEIQKTVADLIKDRILVGHAVYNDLKALLLAHPASQTRDTQSLAYKHRVIKTRRPALRVLIRQELGIAIQGGEHSSVTDARATMALFRLHKKQFESGFRPLGTLAKPRPSSSEHVHKPSPAPDTSDNEAYTKVITRKRKRPSATSPFPPSPSPSPSSSSDNASPSPEPPSPDLPSMSNKAWKLTHKAKPRPDGERQKGVSSGLSTVIKRSGMKEVKGKGIRSRISSGGSVSKAREKWWTSLGGGARGSKGTVRL
ncbi:ribonuclease H-like domain-containing protein [Phlebopus sp. FC_14]|nr:ribonuclease H-like domain-containing protein [Phlebopus sp. FC_14]